MTHSLNILRKGESTQCAISSLSLLAKGIATKNTTFVKIEAKEQEIKSTKDGFINLTNSKGNELCGQIQGIGGKALDSPL